MTARILKRDSLFYPALLALWIMTMFMTHKGHYYFGRPLPSIDLSRGINPQTEQLQMITASIEELKKSLKTETSNAEIPHIHHNIGISFYDLHKIQRHGSLLDSAQYYMEQSLTMALPVARFYYNYGRLFTERGNHPLAARQYAQAIAIEPTHVLALHNLGLLTYFELKNLDAAQQYLEQALAVDPNLPMCNYVLGEIALDKKDFPLARGRFEREAVTIHHMFQQPRNLPVNRASLNYALANTHKELAVLYSTVFPDRNNAQANLNAYLQLESNQQRREEFTREMKRYWLMK